MGWQGGGILGGNVPEAAPLGIKTFLKSITCEACVSLFHVCLIQYLITRLENKIHKLRSVIRLHQITKLLFLKLPENFCSYHEMKISRNRILAKTASLIFIINRRAELWKQDSSYNTFILFALKSEKWGETWLAFSEFIFRKSDGYLYS